MTIKLINIGVILGLVWKGAVGSVAGLTYMDDFDFEQRYRNVHECDPFYWHPLHLPEECADMYEKLIRNRLPVRFAKRTSNVLPVHVLPNIQSFGEIPMYQPIIEVDEETSRELTPYEEMLKSVQRDVNNFPSVPSVKDMPNFGPVAVYQQPVSQITANMIKKVATTYIASSDDKDATKNGTVAEKVEASGRKWLIKCVSMNGRAGRKLTTGILLAYRNLNLGLYITEVLSSSDN